MQFKVRYTIENITQVAGYQVVNTDLQEITVKGAELETDSDIMLQFKKLIAKPLGLSPEQVNLKAIAISNIA